MFLLDAVSRRYQPVLRGSQELPLRKPDRHRQTGRREASTRRHCVDAAQRICASARTDGVEAVRHQLGRNVPAACAGGGWNRRGGSHSPPQVLVVERLPRPTASAAWMTLRFRFAWNADEPRSLARSCSSVPRYADRRAIYESAHFVATNDASAVGQPIVRSTRFRRHSAAAMKRDMYKRAQT